MRFELPFFNLPWTNYHLSGKIHPCDLDIVGWRPGRRTKF